MTSKNYNIGDTLEGESGETVTVKGYDFEQEAIIVENSDGNTEYIADTKDDSK